MLAVTRLWFNRGSFWELVELNPRFRYRKISRKEQRRRTARTTARVSQIEQPRPTLTQNVALYPSKPYPGTGCPDIQLTCLPVPQKTDRHQRILALIMFLPALHSPLLDELASVNGDRDV